MWGVILVVSRILLEVCFWVWLALALKLNIYLSQCNLENCKAVTEPLFFSQCFLVQKFSYLFSVISRFFPATLRISLPLSDNLDSLHLFSMYNSVSPFWTLSNSRPKWFNTKPEYLQSGSGKNMCFMKISVSLSHLLYPLRYKRIIVTILIQ